MEVYLPAPLLLLQLLLPLRLLVLLLVVPDIVAPWLVVAIVGKCEDDVNFPADESVALDNCDVECEFLLLLFLDSLAIRSSRLFSGASLPSSLLNSDIISASLFLCSESVLRCIFGKIKI